MQVPFKWLRQLVELPISDTELVNLLPMKTIGTKDVTEDFVELDMKGYNRADLLSMRGVAYEVAALVNSKVNFQEPSDNDYVWVNQDLAEVSVEIIADTLCPFYCVAKIEGLKVEASSADDQKTLADAGMRSVNNIADITNLVMLEFGQPLHAFDAAHVSEESLIIRSANPDEKITTLDDKERVLNDSMLVIADKNQPVGIAGVMGGKDSEVNEKTETILLEAAIFAPKSLRKTSTDLGLNSEASKRFYHGLTKRRLMQALDAAIRQYQQMGGKLVGLTIKGDFQDIEQSIELRLSQVKRLIGIDIEGEQVEKILSSWNFKLDRLGDDKWQVIPPYWRQDCVIEADLIEEIARMYGYDQIPAKELPGQGIAKIDQSGMELVSQVKNLLVKLGLSEIQTYSFIPSAVIKALELQTDQLIKVANPISSETEYMRQDLWPNILDKVILNSKIDALVGIFEIGKVYQVNNGKVKESLRLSVGISGGESPIYELMSVLDQLSETVKYNYKYQRQNDKANFHPRKFAQLEQGIIGEVHPRVIDQLGGKQKIAIAEIDLLSNV